MKHLKFLVLFLYPSVLTAQEEIRCPIGWGISDSSRVIPASRINDGYCDCPTNGADETETAACSGMNTWPGTQQTDQEVPSFQCPQQPKLKLPLSQLQDGICDCCDGVDETPTTSSCQDRCDELLKAEREARKQLEQAFRKGSIKRHEAISAFANFQTETKVSMEKVKADLQVVDLELEQAQSRLGKAKLDFLNQRLEHLNTLVQNVGIASPIDEDWKGLLDALSNDELIWFTIHACQLAGEMDRSSPRNNEKTCVALRLAGLDAALLWEAQTYNLTRIQDKEGKVLLADLVDYNFQNSKPIWNEKGLKKKNDKPNKRRRLMEEDWEVDEYEDDIYDDDELYDRHRHMEDDDDNDELDDDEPDEQKNNKREELLKLIKEKSFSQPRVQFLEQSSVLIDKIKEILDAENDEPEDKEEEEEDEKEEKDTTQQDDDSQGPSFDPVALPMVRNKLEKREKLIQRGLDYAVSAKVLLDAVMAHPYKSTKDTHLDLTKLALGTLNHGNLSALQVWKLLQVVIPELATEDASDDAQTCRSPWAGSCPPRSMKRTIDRKSIQVPAPAILKLAEAFCKSEEAGPPVCTSDDAIPSEVSDGHFGYYEVQPRGDDDILATLFENLTLDNDSPDHKEVKDLQMEANNVESDKRDLEQKMQDLEESIGGEEGPSKFGPDGELHSLRDECYSVEAGKYEYEVCLFGEARQKEKGQGGRGTNLGSWTNAEVDEETGQRIWKWENGAKCWNGPNRSVTAYVTCGPETKVFHAEEPDTCRYELEVESHVACDEAFRIREGL